MRLTKGRMGPAWTPRGSIVRALVAVAFAGLSAAACKDATGPEQLTTLTITPTTATVGPGGTVQFTAVGTRTGQAVTNIVGQRWSVTGGGSITNSGLFTAPTTPGTSTITVTCGGLSTVTTVTVTAGPLATITVTPNPVTLPINTQQQFTAVGRDAFGNVVAITPAPVWSTTNPPGTINPSTGLFTSGTTLGTFPNSVRATSGAIFGTATVTVVAGPLLTITVTPNPATLQTGAQQQFTAVGRDAGNNIVPITPVWTTTNPPGTINATTGLFTAGTTTGTFPNSVRATQGSVFGTATVIVTAPAPPPTPAPSRFRFISRVAFTCTNGTIVGDVGTERRNDEVPPGSITQTPPLGCITGSTEIGTAAAKAAYQAFEARFDALASNTTTPCTETLTGTLAGVIRGPGVYCFPASATLTGTLTLTGPGQYIFKVGSGGTTGALTGNLFNVVLTNGASACNVEWFVREGSTMTGSNFKGMILAGAGVSFTGGTYRGNAASKADVTVTGADVRACDAP